MRVRLPVIPPMFGELIRTTLLAMEGVAFTELAACPRCGAPLRRHDRKEKRFARLEIDGEEKDINVLVSRFRCTSCGGFWSAREPFYEGVRFGIPVVDLALTLAQTHPYHRTERILASIGLLVDRGTIRTYAIRAQRPVPATSLLGMPLPISLIRLSNLVTRRPKGAPVPGAEVLAALGLPPAHRAPEHLPPAPQEGDQGKKEDEEEGRKPGQEKHQGQTD